MRKSRKVKVLNWENIELWSTVDLFRAPREIPSFLSQKKTFGILPNLSFCHTDSLIGICFCIKSQNKATDGFPDIFNTCYSVSFMYAYQPLTKGEKSGRYCLIYAWDILMLKK